MNICVCYGDYTNSGGHHMPLVTIQALVNGSAIDSQQMIYTNTRPLSLVARLSPDNDPHGKLSYH
jgi:hypothetical protein